MAGDKKKSVRLLVKLVSAARTGFFYVTEKVWLGSSLAVACLPSWLHAHTDG